MPGSTNSPPGNCTGVNVSSYASTRPERKLAAYRYVWPLDAWAMASPLYTALAPLITGDSVTVDGGVTVAPTPGFQPSIPPFSESKIKVAGAEWPVES